jgi:hypothetical protein
VKPFSRNAVKSSPIERIPLKGMNHSQVMKINAVVPGYPIISYDLVKKDTLLIPGKLPLTPTKRLVVLVPSEEIHRFLLSNRIWHLATKSKLNVIYLALDSNAEETASQHRLLQDLATFSADREIKIETFISKEGTWMKAVQQITHPGDLLVCLDGHQISLNIFQHRSLGEELAEVSGQPVYLLEGILVNVATTKKIKIQNISAWIISICILAIFFLTQNWMDHQLAKPGSTIIILVSVLIEIFALYKVSDWIG